MYLKYTVITMLCLLIVLGILLRGSNAKIDPEKIVGIWLLDEGNGDAVKDASENELDGTATQSVWVEGKVNGALSIKKGGTVTIPIGKGTIRDKMSFILWLQFTDVAAQ